MAPLSFLWYPRVMKSEISMMGRGCRVIWRLEFVDFCLESSSFMTVSAIAELGRQSIAGCEWE